jgi:hypothetical protein
MAEYRNGFWVVWCEDGGVPTVRHASYEEADREAQRLARANRGRVFFVLRCVGGRTLPAPEPSEIEVMYEPGVSSGERQW